MFGISKKTSVILHDIFMAILAWQFAWLARFNFSFPFPDWQLSFYTLLPALLVQAAIFWRFHLYKGLWRFASLPDLWNIFRAALFGSLCISLTLFILFRLEGVPRSIFILYPMFLIFSSAARASVTACGRTTRSISTRSRPVPACWSSAPAVAEKC